jgi:hypothetical protein
MHANIVEGRKMYSGWNGKYRSEEARRKGLDLFHRISHEGPEEGKRCYSPEQALKFIEDRDDQGAQRARAGEGPTAHRLNKGVEPGSMLRFILVVLLPLILALLALVVLLSGLPVERLNP